MPAGYLLDTNVISETRKTHPAPTVITLLDQTDTADLFLSVLTLGELRKGAAARQRTDPRSAEQLAAWIDGIEAMFADRVLPVDIAAARLWGELSAGRSLPVIDTLLAATAISRGLTLVTRNTGDFAATSVSSLNPWETSR